MKFIPNSNLKNQMLKEIDLRSIDDLFSDIPKNIIIKELDLPRVYLNKKQKKN